MRFLKQADRETLRSWMNELISLPTHRADGVSDDDSFLEAISDGFRWLEGWAEQRSFNCRNWQDKVLEISGGSGPEVALAVHLDVVPFSENDWSVDNPSAFHLRDADEPIYLGRGTIDDKGPLAAILLAIDRLQQEGSIPVSFRLIVDSAEEVGFERIRNYFSDTDAKYPERTLVADGFFPLVAGEKGLLQTDLTIDGHEIESSPDLTLNYLDAGDAYNQVPARAKAVLQARGTDPESIQERFREVAEDLAVEVTVDLTEDQNITIETFGDTAHGSSPDEGLNAGSGLVKLLASDYPFSIEKEQLFTAISERLCEDDGKFLTDASGFHLASDDDRFVRGTTANLGTLNYHDDGQLSLGLDFRLVPSVSPDDAETQLNDWRPDTLPDDFTVTLEPASKEPDLLVDLEEDLPQAALQAYESVRSGDTEPVYMGGRTHAAALDNAFAFGCMEVDRFESYGFHGADEQVPEIELLETAEIYAETLEVFGEGN